MKMEREGSAQRLLAGTFTKEDKPKILPRVVRVFLASNGSDSITERTSFIQCVYPRLREYCKRHYGVEFQVVDLEWGLPENQNLPDDFKQREIRKCQMLSSASSFLVFIGQKYGNMILPSSMPAEEYENIRNALHRNKSRETRTAFLLDHWFIKDDNNIPPLYIHTDIDLAQMQKVIKSQKNYTEGSYHPNTLRELQYELIRLLQKGTKLINMNDPCDKVKSEGYRRSDLERYIQIGFTGCDELDDKCVVIMRNIVDLHNYTEEKNTLNYLELDWSDTDEQMIPCTESQLCIEQLMLKISMLLSKENIIKKDVLWRYPNVINAKLHTEYLSSLCEDLYECFKQQIDKNLHLLISHTAFSDELEGEVSRHWARCFDVAGRYYSEGDTTNKVYDYLRMDSTCPFIVCGPSGSGKTKVVSKVATDTYGVLGEETITVIRFIGYTVGSSTGRQLFHGICNQIEKALGRNTSGIPVDINPLQKYLHDLLENFPRHTRLVIYLDSIDKLHIESDEKCAWLPTSLPDNVKIIVSCYSDFNALTERLFNLVKKSEKILNLSDFKPEECLVALSHFLSRAHRKITATQMANLRPVFENCSSPIFVKLIAHKLKAYKSSDEIDISGFPKNTREALSQLLQNLENVHGKVFVANSLSYLVASKTGLTDCEMDDILSIDDSVLHEIYEERAPILKRVPPAKWLYLKDSIEGFLYSYDSDGVNVNMLKHECFQTAIHERYLDNKDMQTHYHSILSDYFLGKRAESLKSYRQLSHDETDCRYVISQPLFFKNDDEHVRFNQRKFDQLPRHLKGAGRLDELNRLVFFNYQWLYNKTKALSLDHMLEDFAMNPCKEASLVKEALKQSRSTIESDIENIGPELIGGLLPFYFDHPNIRDLIEQCRVDGSEHCPFSPNFSSIYIPGSALRSTIKCQMVPDNFIFLNSDRQIACKQKEDSHIYVYNTTTGRLREVIFASSGELHKSPDGRKFVIVDHVTKSVIKVHDASTGKFIGQIIPQNHINDIEFGGSFKVGEITMSNDILCTTITSDHSFLCIADLNSCNVTKTIELNGKSSFCQIKPDFREVFCNSDNTLLAFDLITHFQICHMSLDFRPLHLTFSNSASHLYIACEDAPLLICMRLTEYRVELFSKVNLEPLLGKFPIEYISVSKDDTKVLIKTKTRIIIYDGPLLNEIAKFSRPEEIPREFKLPKSHYKELFFSDTKFSCDGRFVFVAIFQMVYIWQIDTDTFTTVRTPVGMIKHMLVSDSTNRFITHTERSEEVQVWDLSRSLECNATTEKLTGTVRRICLNKNGTRAYVQCENSDGIGIIDMETGVMIALLTHSRKVIDFAITPSGKYLMTTMDPRLSNSAVNLWNTHTRSVIREFGNTVVKCVSCNVVEGMFYLSQNENTFESPYFVHSIHFQESILYKSQFPASFKYILDEPFLTRRDNFLAILSAEKYQEEIGEHFDLQLGVFDLRRNNRLKCFKPENIADDIQAFVAVRPCTTIENTVAVIYHPKHSHRQADNSARIGLCLFDVASTCLMKIFPPVLPAVTRNILSTYMFSSDFTICLTDQSTVVNLFTLQVYKMPFSMPCALMISDSVLVYSRDSTLHAIRLVDKKVLGKCEVHSPICQLTVCPSNDSILLVGCRDGAVCSYTLTVVNDSGEKTARERSGIVKNADERVVTWDKIAETNYKISSRPPTATCYGPQEKKELGHIEPLPPEIFFRPRSSCSTHSSTYSRACSIM